MDDFFTLSCPSCGGQLDVLDDIEQFKCTYCGTEHIVRRGKGVIALKPLVDGLKRVEVATDKTSSELAISRLEREISLTKIKLGGAKDDFFYQGNNSAMKALSKVSGANIKKFKSFADARKVFDKLSSDQLDELIIIYHNIYSGFFSKHKIERDVPKIKIIKKLNDEFTDKSGQLERHREIVSKT